MPLEIPADFPSAERYGPGKYLVQSTAAGSFSYGATSTMMVLIKQQMGDRFFINGPFYYLGLGTTTLTLLPETVPISTGALQGPAGQDSSGKGYPNPGA